MPKDLKWYAKALVALAGALLILGRVLAGDFTQIPELFDAVIAFLAAVGVYLVRNKGSQPPPA